MKDGQMTHTFEDEADMMPPRPAWSSVVASDDEIFAAADAIKSEWESEENVAALKERGSGLGYLFLARAALEAALNVRGRIVHEANWRLVH